MQMETDDILRQLAHGETYEKLFSHTGHVLVLSKKVGFRVITLNFLMSLIPIAPSNRYARFAHWNRVGVGRCCDRE